MGKQQHLAKKAPSGSAGEVHEGVAVAVTGKDDPRIGLALTVEAPKDREAIPVGWRDNAVAGHGPHRSEPQTRSQVKAPTIDEGSRPPLSLPPPVPDRIAEVPLALPQGAGAAARPPALGDVGGP